MDVSLRPVTDDDLESFYGHLQDADAVWMAAFTPPDPSDREAFDAHWERLRSDDHVIVRTILADGIVRGHIASFDMMGDREITYWLDRDIWGLGVATAALGMFLAVETIRPLHGRASADNTGSRRVMEKCGFAYAGDDRGFSTARDREIDEVLYRLD
jgi:RimJ/RimL family protein N-acetyltransferase